MRKLSEMAKARALVRKIESQDRKKLQSNMRGSIRITIEDLETGRIRRKYYGDYDGKPSMIPATERSSDAEPIKTINDILQEFSETVENRKTKHSRSTQVDKLVDMSLSEDVRDYWRRRINRGSIKFDAQPEHLTAKKGNK